MTCVEMREATCNQDEEERGYRRDKKMEERRVAQMSMAFRACRRISVIAALDL